MEAQLRVRYLKDYKYPRPSRTLELLLEVLAEQTGIRISRSRMCRILKAPGVRRGMSKPIVGCPWSARAGAVTVAFHNSRQCGKQAYRAIGPVVTLKCTIWGRLPRRTTKTQPPRT